MEAPRQAPMEKPELMADDDMDAAMEKTLAAVDNSGGGFNAKAAAAAEERAMAERIAAANAEQPAVIAAPGALEYVEEDLATVASKGRDYLMQKLREHNDALARKPAYKPPEMSAQMRDRINEEMEAGRRAQQRHEEARKAQLPPDRNANEIAAEGSNTPVFRPGNMVTDPRAPFSKEGLAPMRQT